MDLSEGPHFPYAQAIILLRRPYMAQVYFVTARSLMVVSAGIVLLLGLIHLAYTLWGAQLTPRDSALQDAMGQVSLVLTRETTVWKAWLGFNVSHSMGAILFGLVYGYLAFAQAELFFKSMFLLAVGLAMLGGLVVLSK